MDECVCPFPFSRKCQGEATFSNRREGLLRVNVWNGEGFRPIQTQRQGQKMRFINMSAVKPIKTKWLVHGLLASNGKTMVMAQSGSGKSTLARNLSRAVIRGNSFLGRRVTTEPGEGTVLYIHLDAKDEIEDVKEVFVKLGITDEEYKSNHPHRR